MWSAVKKTFPAALPWILLSAGILSLVLGTFVDFTNDKWEKFLTTFGSSILASGIFALILKSIQFLGVFKEELNEIIYEAKYLKNRNDLPIFWEKVTKVLVKDKFPNIHSDIMKDVKDTYLPTALVQYYDNCSENIEIELIDEKKELVRVNHTISFTVIPYEQGTVFVHPYRNQIACTENCPDTSIKLNYVKVNNKVESIELKQTRYKNMLESDFEVRLKDKNGYNLEYSVTKTYSLKSDNIISYRTSYIQNNFKVQFFLKGIEANFIEVGTLNNFKTKHDKVNFIEKEYTGLMYKKQGYLATLKIRK